jgi:methylenetetrahydrofolate dehydrogenase (NADP+)/methenyltetrahydrofolate cyclohydrolase
MNAVMMHGSQIAHEIKQSVAASVKSMSKKPTLAVILVGDNPASVIYVKKKTEACEACGIHSQYHQLGSTITTEDLIWEVRRLNENQHVNGILIQLPLPDHIDKFAVLNSIDPAKDVDCFTPTNLGLLFQDRAILQPCTPSAILELLKFYNIETARKKIAIVNRSIVVGKPLAALLLKEDNSGNATVTICHDQTTPSHLTEITKASDIVVSAVGRPHEFRLESNMISKGAVVIDVGIGRLNGKMTGDCTKDISEKASYLTPSIGGVGPITVAKLLNNTLIAARIQIENNLQE